MALITNNINNNNKNMLKAFLFLKCANISTHKLIEYRFYLLFLLRVAKQLTVNKSNV